MMGMLAGMALMAALAIGLRARGADARLAPALRRLALFGAGLAGLLALDGGPFEPWQVVVLPVLPVLLAGHVESLIGPAPLRIALAVSGGLCLPFLLLPAGARQAMTLGALPELDPRLLLLALGGVGLYWVALIAGTAVSGLAMVRALRRHRLALAQIVAQPPGLRLGGVAVLGLFLALLFALQLLDLVLMGRVLTGALSDLFVLALILGTTLHGLTLRTSWPTWADEVIAPPKPAYARSGLDATTMAQLLARVDAVMARDGLWRSSDLTLADLAQAVRAKPFYLSQALNQGRGESFFDHVNRWRVTEAQTLLRATDQTVLDIALATGFNAKSTFNAAFRKQTGMTPSAWRATGKGVTKGSGKAEDAVV